MGAFIRPLITGIMLYMGISSALAQPVPIAKIWLDPLPGSEPVRIELQVGRRCVIISGARLLMREVQIEDKVLTLKQMDALANVAVMYQASEEFKISENFFAALVEKEASQVAREIGNREIVETVVDILVKSLRSSLFQTSCPKIT